MVPKDSCAHDVLNPSVFNHPCLVMETSSCGHLALCLQVTSFGNGGIQDKYANCHNPETKKDIFDQYVAIGRSNDVAHNHLDVLN